ncbi:electron-transferring-flavoprotein dehydrogenase [Pseudomonas cuatrocienegasensis]|uniref:Electron transfer flavoprotein-ubiquinone oxidoreductase n=1 Tax=Pseudomonas cuatrocienegasensis TaxID=543360 RepID=A0ABY1BML2_9PSED|nr:MULTISPECIES: electron transfer flavoprotein-ubiquinone oxidoreductase [Pseudomonas]OEC34424.1 electron transfer flavoprotein-ubiquinone oxidoreductase [Pseudomonas sp. 21C1]SER19238.1 electron-transferring-flavoprotein dehydrogenase [Pseudomonas cuatrocienegasensis]
MTPHEILAHYGPRESMDYDVVIVGAGPAGLAAAIRLKQRAAQSGREISVVVLEKGSEPGAHILSGAVMDPRALTELLPDWQALGAPLLQPVTNDEVLLLSKTGSLKIPQALVPNNFHNAGNYVISLGSVVRWLAAQADRLGVEIFPGFAAAEVLYTPDGAVKGVATGHMGLAKDGTPTEAFTLGMELHAKYTVFAEGARGHLGRELLERFQLQQGKAPQSFSIGLKELWEIPAEQARPGTVIHTAGWPMDAHTFGGGFLYHLAGNQVSLGLVVGLDYKNPWLSPFEEMQRWKTHPAIRAHLAGGKRLSYGARAINNGGLASLPKTQFPGGALIGCDAGLLNASRIKGSHAALKSGMLVADALFDALASGRQHDELNAYAQAFEQSWLHDELKAASNFKPWFKKGRAIGMLMTGVEHWLLPKLGIHTPPWVLKNPAADHTYLQPAAAYAPIRYPKADGTLTFDRLSSVFISDTHHADNQPAHLRLINPSVPVAVNLQQYAGPEARYCPAGVYEYVADPAQGGERLQINAQNCLHCKTCDIKDPTQNILWTPPEGGGGPNYAAL